MTAAIAATRRWLHTLRAQLALVGFVGMVVPIAMLLAVVFVTESEIETDVDDAGASTTTTSVTEETSGVSPLVPLTAALLALPAAAAVWWWAGRAVRPIDHITSVADDIQEGSLDRRIGERRAPTEVQALAGSFDRMLDRLAQASATQRQLIEDTSHELRTPLAALAANVEVMLASEEPTLADYRAATARIEAMVERLQITIESLLVDARHRSDTVRQVDNDIMAIVERVAGQQRALSPDLAITVDGPAVVHLGIDGASVERAVANLVHNAARFSPPDGVLAIEVRRTPTRVELSVIDQGPGIEPGEVDRLFDRYYRSPASGDGAGEVDGADGEIGHGLGLALVKQVADAYGGITVTSPLGPDGGSRFTLVFPVEGDGTGAGEPASDETGSAGSGLAPA